MADGRNGGPFSSSTNAAASHVSRCVMREKKRKKKKEKEKARADNEPRQTEIRRP
jgi:hypothetical protein